MTAVTSTIWLEAKCDLCGELIFAERVEEKHHERARRFGEFWLGCIKDHVCPARVEAGPGGGGGGSPVVRVTVDPGKPTAHTRPIDTLNRFMVAKAAAGTVIMRPPGGPISDDEALILAAYLVALTEGGGDRFAEVLRAVEMT